MARYCLRAKEWFRMGRKVTAFSDLSGAEVPEEDLGQLVIRDHPGLSGPAVYLEALPDEVTALDKVNVPMVTIEWRPPGNGEHKTYTLTVADFDSLLRPAPRASCSTAHRVPAAAGPAVETRRLTTRRSKTPGGRIVAASARRKRRLCANTWTR
jgi:hypothetical protein